MFFIELIKNNHIDCRIICDRSNNDISDIVLNSKLASKANIFTAIKGFKTDGHKFIKSAFENGCRDFIVEDSSSISADFLNNSTVIQVADSRKTLADLSLLIFNNPSSTLKMIGITGTKGKSTVTTLIYNLIKDKYKSSMFSTINNITAGEIKKAERTTMEANELNSLLHKSLAFGETISVVEVSSHAVTLKRVENINWDIGVFTSFSRDHLDLYGTMENYFEAKLDFFRALNKSCKKNKIAVINMDDPKSADVIKIIDDSVKIVTVGSERGNNCLIKKFSFDPKETLIQLSYLNKDINISTKMKGDFNITNIALAIVSALELGISIEEINEKLKDFKGVEGRFEIIIEKPFHVIIDYAHTPLSLENILKEGKRISKKNVYLVFGCTGDRDKDKRSIMGEVAALNADFSYITNDDTYTEDPEDIVKQIINGFQKSNKENYQLIFDRKKAIEESLNRAEDDDVIIIAGMGHQREQILNNKIISHSDKETVLELLKKRAVR